MLNEFLTRARLAPEFRDEVSEFLRTGRPGHRITFDLRSPPVKVERVLTKLLAAEPELAIERVEVEGVSGCEFYRGEVAVVAGGERRRFRFDWDCRWRAVQQGWSDYFGFADQGRAAREFGYDCFRVWEEVAEEAAA